jgi:hypothetical protein
MHQITVIEPKWLSEVAPTFFRVADMNKISKRKQGEKIEPLYDRFAADKDDWVSHLLWTGTCTDYAASQQTSARRQVVADVRSGFIPLVNGLCCVVLLYIHALFAILSLRFGRSGGDFRVSHLILSIPSRVSLGRAIYGILHWGAEPESTNLHLDLHLGLPHKALAAKCH